MTGHPRVLVSLGWPVRGGFAMVGSEGVVDGAFRPAVHFSSMHAKRHRARATAPGDHEQRGDGDVLEHLAYGLEEGSPPGISPETNGSRPPGGTSEVRCAPPGCIGREIVARHNSESQRRAVTRRHSLVTCLPTSAGQADFPRCERLKRYHACYSRLPGRTRRRSRSGHRSHSDIRAPTAR